MFPRSGVIYYHDWDKKPTVIVPKKQHKKQSISALSGLFLFVISLGGIAAPYAHRLLLDTTYLGSTLKNNARTSLGYTQEKTEVVWHPLVAPDGATIDPVSHEFSLVIPKIGVNAAVVADVDPTQKTEYLDALKDGIAHSSLSYYPDGGGTVYLFSHSTNYDWFVKDLNAAFYLLKNLEEGDTATVVYKQKYYTYKIVEKRVVSPKAVSYLVPEQGANMLILETCWPPGSITERLLIFAELMKASSQQI